MHFLSHWLDLGHKASRRSAPFSHPFKWVSNDERVKIVFEKKLIEPDVAAQGPEENHRWRHSRSRKGLLWS